ncbi:hypothetical protein B0T11DRAFT_356174, partial [Plectosphaerella cucumerina]
LTHALERAEFEVVVRLAGIKNVARCPFCPFFAECPPVEEGTELRCGRDYRGIVSCRLCRQKTHQPKTCEEMRGYRLSTQQYIDEAMSAALIRRCNKCHTPFIKDSGCNKMTCVVCSNEQSYVCPTSCDYAHFGGQMPDI